ncbi:hypothetical protein [Herbaspirillum rubrisubalbicans]|uniref:Uncharacterized protein n=1 Tax=Herbaspirillum rubrisubalbicans TaxID=80842 RepID=A0ABX9C6A8_9BURK|nr:hypothetical protein [Herbaspirillum rubrisubalbicans]RAM66144.1 hypothetical protein RB24_03960 [Herbaspirillum rubrisubalbicans]
MRVAKYLDELQKALNVKTDKDAAKIMGWSHGLPSNWRKGVSFMTNQTAGAISEKIGVPVIEIIAAVEADREEVSGQKSFWTAFFHKTVSATATGTVILSAAFALLATSNDNQVARQGFETHPLRQLAHQLWQL